MNRNQVVDFIYEDMFNNDEKLLYLCEFGSQLYGTDTPESDTDYKGIFLPSLKSLILGKKCNSLRYKTGDDDSRNSKEDTDIELWSLQYFLELVGKGETNAISLLFSPSHKSKVLFKHSYLQEMFDNPLKLFDPIKTKAFVGYAIGQAKKYGIKGSRLGVIKNVYVYMKTLSDEYYIFNYKLGDIVNDILNKFYDQSYCFEKELNGGLGLVLAGKVHMYSINLYEFRARVKKEYEKYGKRAEEAEKNEGIDWKALSHAMRSIFEMEQLLLYGRIMYPLLERSILKKIKKGEMEFNKVEEMIVAGLNNVEDLQKRTEIKGKRDKKFVENLILNFYT